MARGTMPRPLSDRVSEKIRIDTVGCWIWTGYVDAAGYGRIREGGRGSEILYAHRYQYEQSSGPIPAGTELDHLCRIRRCCNPAHLEAVTHHTNVLRGEAPTARLHRAGVCSRGHSLELQYRRPDGSSAGCRVCRSERRRARLEAV